MPRRLLLIIIALFAALTAISSARAYVPVESYGASHSARSAPNAKDDLARETPCDAPAHLRLTPRWIEVSLSRHIVRLCQGRRAWREYLAATGLGDSSDTTTFPGLFTIYEMGAGPLYLSEYDVFISDWVGFDPEHHNGFHSLPMDAAGRVLDDRIGQAVSHGCVRTPLSDQVFQFAEYGMSVWVH